MGESDLYCAFCSGPMLKRRIEFTKRRNDASKCEANYNVGADADNRDDEENIESTDHEDDSSDFEDDRSSGYNPDILSPKSVEWIGVCRCLALNMDRFETDGVGKAFISGHGSPDGLGYFMVHQIGTDPNDTGATEHPCYYSFNPGETAAFPFHDACLEIFARSLGLRDAKIENDVLYDVMESHRSASDSVRYLDLDYTHLEGAEQFWQCYSSLEYCVADPSPTSGLVKIVQDSMPMELLSSRPSAFDFSHKVRHDPLDMLPFAVIHNIFEHIDINDALALRQASWHVFQWTRSDTIGFGKQMIRLHLSPWFWEVDDFVSSIDDPAFDFTRFFLWLEAVTEPKVGMEGPFLGIANRWRIWDTCRQLVLDYHTTANP